LLRILEGYQNFNTVQQETGISPRIVRKYLDYMKQKGLVRERARNWKIGKNKKLKITQAGINWLIDNALLDVLEILSTILSQLRKPENREIFQKVREEKYLQSRNLIKNHFIECHIKGIDPFEALKPLDEWEYKHRFRMTDIDEPLREALRKLFALQLYFAGKIGEGYLEDPEMIIKKEFVLFAPNMEFFFSWDRSKIPKLDSWRRQIWNNFEYWLQQAYNDIRSESEKLEKREGTERISEETHLLGLERVDEKYYDEYLRATDKTSRERILAKIEDKTGWSVGTYLRQLLIGREEEIAKYVDGLQRSSLRKFISLFENRKSK